MTKYRNLQEAAHFRALNFLKKNSKMCQRVLAIDLELRLWEVDYSLKGLVERGMAKAENFLQMSASSPMFII